MIIKEILERFDEYFGGLDDYARDASSIKFSLRDGRENYRIYFSSDSVIKISRNGFVPRIVISPKCTNDEKIARFIRKVTDFVYYGICD